MIITLHITHNCNLRCDYCYGGCKKTVDMPLKTAFSAIKLAEQKENDIFIIFFGGEPLLKKDTIKNIIDFCAERRQITGKIYHFQTVTNGTLLDRDFILYAAKHSLSISLSLDGCEDAHNRHRFTATGEGSFKNVVRTIPDLLEFNPYLHVQTVVSPDTAELLPESLDFIFSKEIRFVSTTLDHSANWSHDSLTKLRKAYEKSAQLYINFTRNGKKFYLSCFDTRIRTHIYGKCEKSKRCDAGQNQFSVAPSGNIYPCVQFVSDDLMHNEYCIGNVTTGFDHDRKNKLHELSESEKKECTGCALSDRCANWCACLNWSATGTLNKVSPIVCEHERILMPIADNIASRLYKQKNKLFLKKHYVSAYPILSIAEDIIAKGASL